MVAAVVASMVALAVASAVAAAWDLVPEGPGGPQGQFPSPTFPCWHGGGSGEAAPGLVIGEHPQQVISWVLISSLHWGAVSLLEAGLEMLGGDSLPVLMHRAPAAPR